MKNIALAAAVISSLFGVDCSLEYYPQNGFKYGPFWKDAKCQRHFSNTVPVKRAIEYGVFKGLWRRLSKGKIEYADTKVRIKVSNRCYFLVNDAYYPGEGWKRNEWRKIGNDTVEIHIGKFSDKGASMYLPEPGMHYDKKKSWNIFDSPLNCSDYPQHETWTILQKIDGHWQTIASQDFYLR